MIKIAYILHISFFFPNPFFFTSMGTVKTTEMLLHIIKPGMERKEHDRSNRPACCLSERETMA